MHNAPSTGEPRPLPGPSPTAPPARPRGLLLGIEIGGTKLQLGLGRGDGRFVAFRRLAIEPAAGAAGIRAQIEAGVGPLLDEAGADRDDLAAVGIGFGGPVDAVQGLVTTSHQVAGWDGFPLAAWARDRLGVARVALQNDADTAGLGEARFGAGVGLSPVLYVTVGSGIGGGLIVDGRIYRGSGSGAAEIGHLWIDDDGGHGPTPRRLEEIASGWSIGHRARELVEEEISAGKDPSGIARLVRGEPSRVTAAVVAEAAGLGDPLASAIVARAARAMARGLAHAVTLLAPRRIILGGGVSLMRDDLWIGPIRRLLDDLAFPPFRGTFDLVPAALGEDVVVHGALALALELAPPPPR